MLANKVNNVDFPVPVGANTTPNSPIPKPPLSTLSKPLIPVGMGHLLSFSNAWSML